MQLKYKINSYYNKLIEKCARNRNKSSPAVQKMIKNVIYWGHLNDHVEFYGLLYKMNEGPN